MKFLLRQYLAEFRFHEIQEFDIGHIKGDLVSGLTSADCAFGRRSLYWSEHEDRPMLNPKTVNLYGFVAIGIMMVMLILIWARLVPREMYMPLFLVAAALFMIRITLRLVLARQERELRKSAEESKSNEGDEPDHV